MSVVVNDDDTATEILDVRKAVDLAKKSQPQPPEESRTDIQNRLNIKIAFWLVAILLGLPLWIWTTTVHRAALPLDVMQKWGTGTACNFQFPLEIRIKASTEVYIDIRRLVQLVQTDIDQTHQSSLRKFRIIEEDEASVPESLVVQVQTSSEKDVLELKTSLHMYEALMDVQLPSSHKSNGNPSLETLAIYISQELKTLFADEEAMLAQRIQLNSDEIHKDAELTRRDLRTFKYASNYHLTFSLFTADATISSWAIKEAIDEYLQPLLSAVSKVSTFTLDTQIQLHASLSPTLLGPTFDETSKEWILERSDLSSFINAAEWPLNPAIGKSPTINFVLYIPASSQQPLVLRDPPGGTSWLIPQWGGVQILNTNNSTISSALDKTALKPIILTFADNLLTLLGLPRAPSSVPLKLSFLSRDRSTSLILSASSTLGALARLTLKLPSIAIPNSVADAVQSTISHLDNACHDLRHASYDSALAHAREAQRQAEEAFFEPSMVGQVYFPDEHKVAVYVPLLGPISVPLILAALKEIKRWKESRRR